MRFNPWGWTSLRLQEMMEGAHEREHPRPKPAPIPEGKTAHHKGYRILPASGGWMVPELEAESRFDSVKDAKRFIGAQEKGRRNPDLTRFRTDESKLLHYIVTVDGRAVFQTDDRREAELRGERYLLEGLDAAVWRLSKPSPSYLKSAEYRKVSLQRRPHAA